MATSRNSFDGAIYRDLFIFISQTSENLVKVAERHRIKKEIDYTQVDLFINDPRDKAERPYKVNSEII